MSLENYSEYAKQLDREMWHKEMTFITRLQELKKEAEKFNSNTAYPKTNPANSQIRFGWSERHQCHIPYL